MLELTRNNRYASSVYVYDENEYAEMRMLVTDFTDRRRPNMPLSCADA
ncbi:hypothetical protein ACFWAY_30380 [Rhodococcus sp. NPDC059968]